MSLLSIILAFVIVGVALWLVNAYIPMDDNVKRIMNVAVIIFLVLWLLFQIPGLGSSLTSMRL